MSDFFTPFAGISKIPLSTLYLIPEVHILFVGPPDCARHHCRMHFMLGRMSFLCPTDMDHALGNIEPMILEAVGELLSNKKYPSPKAILLLTGCQGRFLCLDFKQICQEIDTRFHIPAAYHTESRIHGLDEFSSQRDNGFSALMDLLPKNSEQKPDSALVLGRLNQELQNVLHMLGVHTIYNIYHMDTFDIFTNVATSSLCVITDPNMKKAGSKLSQCYGMDCLYLPVSFRLDEIDRSYAAISHAFHKDAILSIREQAESAIARARLALDGQILHLDLTQTTRPWELLRAFMEYGFPIGKVRLLKTPPLMAENYHVDQDWVKANLGDIHLIEQPISQPSAVKEPVTFYLESQYQSLQMKAGQLEPQWGYTALCQLMDALYQEKRKD